MVGLDENNNMGNVQSAAESCASGVESSKLGICTEATSAEIEARASSPIVEPQQHRESFTPSQVEETLSSRSSSTLSSSKRITPKRIFKRLRNRISVTAQGVEDFLFPHSPQLGASSRNGHRPQSITTRVRGGVLLNGCHTDEEHRKYTRELVARLRPLHGSEGLKVAGLEYRNVKCDEHGHLVENESSSDSNEVCEMTRLFHAETNTMISNESRKQFIADGDMYDAVARLCQEYAQDLMIKEANLEWHTVCEQGANSEPIRALVSKGFFVSKDKASLPSVAETAEGDEAQHAHEAKPTLLIATGKGRVRAGIFSRQHLLISGVECSTALEICRDAVKRDMNVVMVDPNVHGDRLGMITFEKSMAKVFHRWEQPHNPTSACQPADHPPLSSKDLYVLSHSQSGAQLARYLLDKSEHYVPHIRAIAFTDSTHNVQWTRENKELHNLLQSPNCLYFKVSKDSNTASLKQKPLAPLDTAGKEVTTDDFFKHRFGRIRTLCAGTTEHSLTNFFAHKHIWGHFDSHLENTGSSHGADEGHRNEGK